jgi:hypothetical protein
MHSSFESYASAGLWKAGYATFPQALENPPGFPQLHSYDDDEMKQRKPLISYRGTDFPQGTLVRVRVLSRSDR